MGGLAVGPFAFSAERAPVIAGLIILIVLATLISRKSGPGLDLWAGAAVAVALIAARAGFVIRHAAIYAADPLSILAFWQGGFDPVAGIAGFAAASLWVLWRRPRLVLSAAVTVAFALAGWNAVRALVQSADMTLPADITLQALDGAPVPVADWQGRPMVLNLWATWCPPCRRELPMMAEVAAANPGADIHFINQGEGPGTIRAYLMREGVAIAPLLDPGSVMMRRLSALGLPVTLFIDADGRVRQSHLGEISRADLLSGIALVRGAAD